MSKNIKKVKQEAPKYKYFDPSVASKEFLPTGLTQQGKNYQLKTLGRLYKADGYKSAFSEKNKIDYYTKDDIAEIVYDIALHISNDQRGKISVNVYDDVNDEWHPMKYKNVFAIKSKLGEDPTTEQIEKEIPFWGSEHGFLTYEEMDETYSNKVTDRYSKFIVYIQQTDKNYKPASKNKGAKGGCSDKFNDCLYECMEKVGAINKKNWRSPELLKSYLGLSRKDKVPLSCLKKIESHKEFANYRFVVSSSDRDCRYVSDKKCKFTIKLDLEDEHFKLSKFKKYGLCMAKKEKKIVVFEYNLYGTVTTYDGEIFRDVEMNDFKFKIKDRTTNVNNSWYFYFELDKRTRKEKLEESSELYCKRMYPLIIHDNEILKNATNGRFNLGRASGFTKRASLLDFYSTIPHIQPEEIEQDESTILHKASFGGIIECDKVEGTFHKYDFVACYGSVLSDNHSLFPIGQPEFKTLTENEFKSLEFFPFGLYNVKIKSKKNTFFKLNKEDWYTHTDLTIAKSYGLDMQILNTDDANFLFYPPNQRVTGSQMFKKFVHELFEIRNKCKTRLAKDAVNILWGALCQSYYKTMMKKYDEELVYEGELETIEYNDDGTMKIKISPEDGHQFVTNFGRIKPFVLSYSRKKILDVISKKEIKDNIVWVCIDGFLSKKKIDKYVDDNILGVDMGNLKYEGTVSKRIERFNKLINV